MTSLVSRRRVVGALAAALLSGAVVAHATGSGSGVLAGSSSGLTRPASPVPTVVGATGTGAAAPRAAAASSPATGALPSVAARPATAAPAVVRAPTRLVVPAIDLSMPIEAVAVAGDGQMALPTTAFAAGWYRYGPSPDDRAGATVIAGHVDTAAEGAGPMARLAGLEVGDVVQVQSGGRTRHDYRVNSVESVHKTALDLDALFTRTGAPVLHLVTCGGRYDRVARHYEDNVVVVATPIP